MSTSALHHPSNLILSITTTTHPLHSLKQTWKTSPFFFKLDMATFQFCTSPSFTIHNQKPPRNLSVLLQPPHFASCHRRRRCSTVIRSYKVLIEHEGNKNTLEVDPDETILDKVLDSGLSVPHDCKLGVCMTCPARLLSGSIDQSEGMLSDDVVEKGYALLCVAYPRSDCHIRIIPEEELLSLQLATAND